MEENRDHSPKPDKHEAEWLETDFFEALARGALVAIFAVATSVAASQLVDSERPHATVARASR